MKSLIQTRRMIASSTSYLFYVQRNFGFSSNVVQSKGVEKLFRVQDAKHLFNIEVLLLGLYGSIQYKHLQAKHVVEHQKSTKLVGMTASFSAAEKLMKSWRNNCNCLLHIDSRLLQNEIIDTDKTVKQHGTSFFTKYAEHENSVLALPLCVIEDIELIDDGKVTKNPFYVAYKPDVQLQFQEVYHSHLTFLQEMFYRGQELTHKQRQKYLINVIESYDDFYARFLKHDNPFAMNLEEYYQQFSHLVDNHSFLSESKRMTVKEFLLIKGSEFLSESQHFKRLLSARRRFDIME